MQQKDIQQTHKNARLIYGSTSVSFDKADEGQKWDTSMFLVTTFEIILTGLTHYQTTNFRLFQIERLCRRQLKI